MSEHDRPVSETRAPEAPKAPPDVMPEPTILFERHGARLVLVPGVPGREHTKLVVEEYQHDAMRVPAWKERCSIRGDLGEDSILFELITGMAGVAARQREEFQFVVRAGVDRGQRLLSQLAADLEQATKLIPKGVTTEDGRGVDGVVRALADDLRAFRTLLAGVGLVARGGREIGFTSPEALIRAIVNGHPWRADTKVWAMVKDAGTPGGDR